MFEHTRTQVTAVALVALAGAVPGFGQTITSVQRVGPDGEPSQYGVYYHNRPKVDTFVLECPSDTFSKEIMSEASVTWSTKVGASAGVEWGPVKGSVEAELGVQIGEKKTVTRTYNYGPIPWYSKQYCIFISYGRFRVKGTDARGQAFDVFVMVPEGTFTKSDRRAPECPCEEVSRATDDAFGYADTLPPGSPQHTLVLDGAAALDAALVGGYDNLADNLTAAVGSFAEAVALGADPIVLDGVLTTASTALDLGVQIQLDFLTGGDPSVGGAYSDDASVVDASGIQAAGDALRQARDVARSSGPIERWFEALQAYGQAVSAVFAAFDEVDATLATDEDCAGEGDVPGLCCRADMDDDGRLTIFDFLVFQNLFVTGDLAADFDGDGSLTLFDFLAFQNEFDAGCL